MNDAMNLPQTALVLGGTSDIATAIVERLATEGLRTVILAARNHESVAATATRLVTAHPSLRAETLDFDASDLASHPTLLDRAVSIAGDLDLVVLAAALLGTPDDGTGPLRDRSEVLDVALTNFTGAVSLAQLASDRLYQQGHGTLVVLSSAGALRPRRTNPVYGGTKAGLDGFAVALADRLHGSGVHVMIVRPGFVRTKMTASLRGAIPPGATTPQHVAAAVFGGLRHRRRIVWVPRQLALSARVIALAPAIVARRLPW